MRQGIAILSTMIAGSILGAACSLGALDGFSGGAQPGPGSPDDASPPDGGTSTSSSSSSSSGGPDASNDGPGSSDSGAVTGTSSYRDTVMADTPIGYWRLGEATGVTAKDELGRNPGGYQGGVMLGEAAVIDDADTAVSFNGTNGRISVGDVLDFLGNVPISLEAWISLNVVDTDYKRVIAKRGNGGGYSLLCHKDYMGCAFELIGVAGATCDIKMDLNQWYHLVGTYDGATVRAYRDGVEVCNRVATITLQKVNAPLVFGAWPAGGNYFNGKIDEIAIYDKALTVPRILEHAKRRKP